MTLSLGSRLGPYQVLARIGAGGMGEVYRAHDPRLGRDVAIKVLPAHLAAEGRAMARFEREARAVAVLSHPNILAILEFGEQDGAGYAVMELLEGEDLRSRIQGGALAVRKAVEYAIQAARGLAAAHQRGIVHRDLKPENLFITRSGPMKILDFGLAKLMDPPAQDRTEPLAPGALDQTEPGMILGTAKYMSPEQVRGHPADHRSDIFSLGAILHEMLSGRPPFRGETPVETMSAILRDEPPDLSEENPAVSPALSRIVRHCLEKEPDGRFQSARDLAFDLESLTAESGPAPAVDEPPGSTRARRRGSLAGGLVAGAVLGALAALLAGRGRRAEPPPAETPSLRFLTYSGHDTSPAASPDGKVVAFSSDRDGRPRIWLKQLAGGDEAALTAGPDDYPRFSPDGSMILFTREDAAMTSIGRVSVLGGEPRRILEDAADGDWSPDGREIVFMRWRTEGGRTESTVNRADADGGNIRQIARLLESRIFGHPRWSPDGATIAISGGVQQAGEPPSIILVEARGGGQRRLPAPRAVGAISSVAWLGPETIVYSQAVSVVGSNAGSAARLVRQNVRTGTATPMLWSPSSSLVLDRLPPGALVFDARSPRQNLREIPLSGRGRQGERWLTRGSSTDRQPVYSRSGWIVFSSNRSGNLDLWAVSPDSGAIRRLTDDEAEDWDPGLTPDGSRLLWSSNRSGHFEIWIAEADGSAARQLTADGVDAENPTATPDGKWIVYKSGNPEKAGVWKIRADGAQARRIVAGDIALPEVSPDGRYVLYRVSPGPRLMAIEFVRLEDGSKVPFEIPVAIRRVTPATLGRARWMPDGGAVAFIGQDEKGVNGVYLQEFAPGRDTRTTRRPLGGFDPDAATESFGISPEGDRMTVAAVEQMFSVMSAEGPSIASLLGGPRAAR